jgi:hypothetical protein
MDFKWSLTVFRVLLKNKKNVFPKKVSKLSFNKCRQIPTELALTLTLDVYFKIDSLFLAQEI